jgi:glycerol-3-phosphate dehydrogenase
MHDLVVIGGGISGLGVARAAAKHGLRGILLEAEVCGEQTSANTLRIIHGGFRYLQSLDFRRMFKSLGDQRDLLRELPTAVKPLPCIMPLNRFGLKSRIPVTAAALMYGGALTLKGSELPWPRVVGGGYVNTTIPFLQGRSQYGALEWHDVVMTNPEMVARYLRSEAEQGGVSVREKVRVGGVARVGESYVVTLADGEVIEARSVVSTLGPWVNCIERPEGVSAVSSLWCKGFNITVRRQIDPRYGIGVESNDGRLFFIVPRGSDSAIGTWYVPVEGPVDKPAATEEELTAFIDSFNQVAPQVGLSLGDVVSVDVGVLPMVRMSTQGPVVRGNGQILKSHRFVEVLSTKYTTFRSQGEGAITALLS